MKRSSSTEDLAPAGENPGTRSVRQRIVDAALELAQTVGVQGMSQARVAAAAGVRQSHLTYYFPTRADLIKATVHAISDQMLEGTKAALSATGLDIDPVLELRNFCMKEVCDLGKARLLLSLMVVAEEEPSLHQWNDEFHRETIGQWLEVYRNLGFDVNESDIELFHATFVGATLLGAQSGSDEAWQRAARVAGQAFDRLLQTRKPEPLRKARGTRTSGTKT